MHKAREDFPGPIGRDGRDGITGPQGLIGEQGLQGEDGTPLLFEELTEEQKNRINWSSG